ncbi:asparagine synthase (glutamine-hydrolyzing) [Schleiferiaceae bacterium]|nr:asparagine synthase (glutamine-hydrolyzing) [Schleiferiaceae bacterium]
MCGIAGFIDVKVRSSHSELFEMTSSIKHRGPDATGDFWNANDTFQIGLGHARLSILDLSEGANQPMEYDDYVIVYNGEVYNFKEVRQRLVIRGVKFKTNSDTEVILKAFIHFGKKCVDYFIGMFAFVIYHKSSKELILFRDRAGVKPLYYFYKDGFFAFASELKALMAHKFIPREVNQEAMGMYFKYGYVPSPHAIFNDTHKLEPGTWLEVSANRNGTLQLSKGKYWSINKVYEEPKYEGSYEDARAQLKELLDSASTYRMISDVPVGVFLSGGYDSSTVAAILQKGSGSRIKTFTIGFNEGNDESKHARKVASYLGTDHNELICTEEEAKDLVKLLPHFYDEPFSDSSAIPTMLVSKFARELVTVALSADGGDELFAGYSRYKTYLKSIQYFQARNGIFPQLYKLSYNLIKPALGYKYQQSILKKLSVAENAYRLATKQERSALVFKEMNSAPYSYLKALMPNYQENDSQNFGLIGDYKSDLDIALVNDYDMYLQNDILTKVDRATMAFSLEGREPLLDHRLIEYSATLPDEFKLYQGNSKRILKDIAHELIPEEILNRPKAGFSIPIDSWLRNDLSYLIEDFLEESKVNKSYFNYDFIKYMISAHKRGNLYFSVMLWRTLMWQMWYLEWVE